MRLSRDDRLLSRQTAETAQTPSHYQDSGAPSRQNQQGIAGYAKALLRLPPVGRCPAMQRRASPPRALGFLVIYGPICKRTAA